MVFQVLSFLNSVHKLHARISSSRSFFGFSAPPEPSDLSPNLNVRAGPLNVTRACIVSGDNSKLGIHSLASRHQILQSQCRILA